MSAHPYAGLPARAFWKKAIAERHFLDLEGLGTPIRLSREDRVATAGSCFAQHIGNRLQAAGARYLDYEPAPTGWSQGNARKHGFGVYSGRYGNIYTTRQLLQLAREATGADVHEPVIWERDGRYFDALRPSVDPAGHARPEDVVLLRQAHLEAVARLLDDLDVLVFTLGLTETWEDRRTGRVFPAAPGTIAGQYDPASIDFVNLRHGAIMDDLTAFHALLKARNPKARMVLTVSPVPLTATASGEHVLAATTYSKSVLRAAAGDFAADHDDVSYFPSYEIITAPAAAGMFFNRDLRSVNGAGVDYVMKTFFSVLEGFEPDAAQGTDIHDLDLICEEGALEKYAG
ncbi:GSCFA domain-containing protein [Profundibacterium mesophilum]|uniref:GSCFA family domain containing protein n=1 Tax=Profundibacterium mesophilum KAUST100406-0324 TaxID=1037889 RepID=A0A921TGB5_9RHOB|nr:GSCFA domain-containing protein [Profundibacterium mesophilum]KAF0677294.1 GSCFA family domain containing protein [Profundibacterium mesophilum KAUST100406-0324]